MLEGYICPEIPSVEDTIGSSKYHEYNLERFLYCNTFNGWLLHIPANNPCIFKTRTSIAIKPWVNAVPLPHVQQSYNNKLPL
jgi:hypothetical protein